MAGDDSSVRTIRVRDARWLLRLAGELSEIRSAELQRQHALAALCANLNAHASAMAVCVDFRAGGRAYLTEVADVWTGSPSDRLPLLSHYAVGAAVDPAMVSMMQRALPPRGVATLRRRDLMRDREWYRADFVSGTRRKYRLDDAVYSMLPIGDDRALGICLNRAWGERPFTSDERSALQLFHETFRWLWSKPDSPGPGPGVHLSPRELDTFDLLLAGLSRKAIAARLAIRRGTVDDYVKSLFRKLGVHSRGELLARFVPRR